MSRRDDDETRIGTYLKVIRFSDPMDPDGFVILYLRPTGRFLFTGYWSGFERSVVAGTWQRQGDAVHLKGYGRCSTDRIPGPAGGCFERSFRMENANRTPILTTSEKLAGWSLLSWTGPFTYVGRDTVIDPDGRWVPKTLSRVDEWIQRLARE